MSDETLEKLEQEITLNLQRIDSNLSYCYGKITKEIIPRVTRYGDVCDEILDGCSWLGAMFQQSGNVPLQTVVGGGSDNNNNNNLEEEKEQEDGVAAAAATGTRSYVDEDDEFHTANITSTGQVLKLPDSSDDDDDDDDGQDQMWAADGSTLQKQRKKRKVSLLLQREYGSSSSFVNEQSIKSSPLKQSHDETIDESTKQVPKPGTVIHFSTS